MYDKRSIMKQENMELLLKKKEDLELLLKKKGSLLYLLNDYINDFNNINSKQQEISNKYKKIYEDVLRLKKETDEKLLIDFQDRGLDNACTYAQITLTNASKGVASMQSISTSLADEIQLLKQKIAGCHLRLKAAENANAKAKIKATENTENTKAKIKKTSEINSSVGRNLASRYRETVGILQKLKSAKAMDVYSFLSDDVAKTVSYIQFRSWLNKQAQKENNIIVYDAKRPSGTGAKATTYKISL